MTNDERLSWRRLYTINWLYNLVNVFSSIVVQRSTMKGEHHIYEDVDWSTTGPWNEHRRLFGLNEFAGAITALAMQKPNTDTRQKILPHHVFQLQCIVDSLMGSRGWTISPLRGHVLDQPARKFTPRRDVDLFLDREVKREGRGVLQSIEILKQLLDKDAKQHQDPNRHKDISYILEELKFDFVNRLGESKYMYGLTTIPPSRFSRYNANGLWEYSPLLCAAGLVEGLVLIQRVAMLMWDRMPESTLVLHLHNILVQKGYIKEPIGLYETLQNMLTSSFFSDRVPESNFSDALLERAQVHNSRESLRQRKEVARDPRNDIHQLLDIRLNRFFKTKTALAMYYDVDWIPDRIPDSAVHIPSFLYMVRLRETKQVIDFLTGKRRLDETELVKRAKALGRTESSLYEAATFPIGGLNGTFEDSVALMERMEEFKGYTVGPELDPYNLREKRTNRRAQGRDFLGILRGDFFADVCGKNPMSSFNYISVTVTIMMLFMDFEDRFQKARHPLYVAAYENPLPRMRRQKRLALVTAAIANEDDGALKLFARGFEKWRVGALNCIYWDDLREQEWGLRPTADSDEALMDACSVM